MDVGLIVAFWGVAALFVITPGADWAYAISAGLHNRSPLPAVLGMLVGHLIATLAVAAGVGALVSRYPMGLTVMTLVGACYLVWLGVSLLRSRSTDLAPDDYSDATSSWAQLAKGIGVSGLNPKVFLLFLALLPQFTDPSGTWFIGVQLAVLGSVHVASCAIVYLAVGFGARRVLRARPGAAMIVTRLSGVVMIGLGVALAVEQIIS